MKPDWKVAGLCMLGALLFWLMNALNKQGYSTRLAYPLQVAYDDSLYVPTSPLPRQIQASITGSGWDLLWRMISLGNEPIRYSVVNPLHTKFINTTSLTDLLSNRLQETHVNYIIADSLNISFERRVVKTVKLMADTSGVKFPSRFVVSTVINVIPQTITVEGPESAMREIPSIIQIPLPKKITGDFDEQIPIPLVNNPHVNASSKQVNISFEIAELLSPLPVKK
ncbi:hypothetical protein BWI96_02725 [Siphonobacter sp. SORGH_AS_0500]|nr:hypothetical protein BWI96_02725 [Siphonobacter sp. SORGH_AS_0500]